MTALCKLALFGWTAWSLITLASAADRQDEKFAPGKEHLIWPGGAPGTEQWTLAEQVQDTPQGPRLINVTQPTLTLFQPAAARRRGTAVIVCAGGGFRTLPVPTQQDEITKALLDAGVTVLVLKYRLMQNNAEEQEYRRKLGSQLTPEDINRDLTGDYMRPIRAIAAADGRQAIALVRAHAAELGVPTNRIGMIGFSSGGVLDVSVALEHDTQSRPDFIGTFYGAPPDAAMTVPADAPPHYIATVSDDPLTWKGSLLRYEEWQRAKRRVELHVYGVGGHGFRNGGPDATVTRWRADFLAWLRQEGFLSSSASLSHSTQGK